MQKESIEKIENRLKILKEEQEKVSNIIGKLQQEQNNQIAILHGIQGAILEFNKLIKE
jgi:archaellum component FlaC